MRHTLIVIYKVGADTSTRYSTMPLDTVKTRMQSLNAKKEYRSSLHCAMRTYREEGLRQVVILDRFRNPFMLTPCHAELSGMVQQQDLGG